jgi:23S rRNA (guanine745-N1)-methyltransferase
MHRRLALGHTKNRLHRITRAVKSLESSKFSLFRCPVCAGALTLADRALQCPKRHSFDLAKTGYVNLLVARGPVPASGGDDSQQLARRDAFLGRGHFDGIADAVADSLAAGGEGRVLLDAGCATAYHLRRLAQRLARRDGAEPQPAGIDISKYAAAHAARKNPEMAFAVADIWRPWPVRDAVVDVVLSVFAPKNFPEAARVLRPGGTLAVAYPGPDHLAELRQIFSLLEQHEGKAADYAAAMERHVGPPEHRRLKARVPFERDDIANAILMGPNAHRTELQSVAVAETCLVTVDIELLIARKAH